jgi:hypothetical protein
MKKFLIIATTPFFALATTTSASAAEVKISPQLKVSKKNPIIKIKASDLPEGNGIYISQCMAPKVTGTAPTACNPSKASKLWVSDRAEDQQMGAKASSSKLSIKVDKYFKEGDCVHTTCVIYVTNDHNAPDDRSSDKAIKFKFGGFLPF